MAGILEDFAKDCIHVEISFKEVVHLAPPFLQSKGDKKCKSINTQFKGSSFPLFYQSEMEEELWPCSHTLDEKPTKH